jgi:hypothetical protein
VRGLTLDSPFFVLIDASLFDVTSTAQFYHPRQILRKRKKATDTVAFSMFGGGIRIAFVVIVKNMILYDLP